MATVQNKIRGDIHYEDLPHVLVVDDDDRIRSLAAQYLNEHGFLAMSAGDAMEAEKMLQLAAFDALVVDVMMPGKSGLDFIKELRTYSDTPVIMLTALGEIEDKAKGYESGADDYLPKPFDPRELVMRLEAIIKRRPPTPEKKDVYNIGPWVFHPQQNQISKDDQTIKLTDVEATLLKVLAGKPEEILSREALAKLCGIDAGERTIDVQVTRLRRKLEEDTKNPRYLQTVRGKVICCGLGVRVSEEPAIKKYLPRTLFGRSLMILITPVLLIQVFTTFMFFDRHWDKMTARLAFALSGEIAIIANRYEQSQNPASLESITTYAEKYLDIRVQFEPQGVLTPHEKKYLAWEHIVVKSLSRTMDQQVRRPYTIDLSLQEKSIEISVQLTNGVLHIFCPHRRLFSSSGYIFLLWMIGSSILMLAIAIIFMRNQIRPIRKLAVAAERYGKGRDVPFFKPSGAREVRAAAKSFIKMKERLDRQIQQRTSMLAGVSHDLRTPLTRMKLQVAMMEEKQDVGELKEDLDEMERMINAYLDFARGEGQEELKRVELDTFINRVAQTALRSNSNIYTDIEDGVGLMLRPVAFERCIHNIIGNALNYAENVWIRASKKESGDMVVICFDDDGPGIPEDQFEDVFKPFFRGESSRNKKTGGVGLGLPIAQDIVHGHGGEISLSRSERGGLCVRIELPL